MNKKKIFIGVGIVLVAVVLVLLFLKFHSSEEHKEISPDISVDENTGNVFIGKAEKKEIQEFIVAEEVNETNSTKEKVKKNKTKEEKIKIENETALNESVLIVDSWENQKEIEELKQKVWEEENPTLQNYIQPIEESENDSDLVTLGN